MSADDDSEAPDPLENVEWPFRTERLVIRRARPEDAEATWPFRRLPEVTAWMTSAPPDLDDYRARFLSPGRFRLTLVMEHQDRVVGDLMLAVEDAWAQWEVADRAKGTQAKLGWCLDPAYGGRGLATEGAAALLEIAFDRLGLRRVLAECFADNVPSWRLMERLGMRREQHAVGDSLHRSGEWLDGFTYALLATEWRQRQAR